MKKIYWLDGKGEEHELPGDAKIYIEGLRICDLGEAVEICSTTHNLIVNPKSNLTITVKIDKKGK